MISEYDVVVVGAGMVGAACAALLGRDAGLSVALVDAARPPPAPGREPGLRVSALNRSSERILDAVGAWATIRSTRAGPFRAVEVWDEGSRAKIRFDGADIAEPHLGHIVENPVTVHALLARAGELSNVDLLAPVGVSGLELGGDRVRVTLGDGRVLVARLLIGADGARSRVRAAAGIEARSRRYRQRAVVAHVTTELAHEEVARQRFLETGPLAFLPLADGRSSVVWSLDEALARVVGALDDPGFGAALAEAFDQRLGDVELTTARLAFPLTHLHADRYVRPRVALVGDAAHVVHPLAGLGVNLGLLDAAALAEVVTAATRRGRDPGSFVGLRRYERWRRAHNAAVGRLLSAFKLVFGSPLGSVRLARGIGVGAADRLTPVKRRMMRHATGLAGDLPRVARAPR